MDSIQIYNCDDNVVAISSKKNYFIKTAESFYNPSESLFWDVVDRQRMQHVATIKDNPLLAVGMVLTIGVVLIYYFLHVSYVIADRNFLISTLILILNIFIHESGHIGVLKLLYPKAKVRIGFKVIFIYPAFYVDTSYSYFLPKYKRIAVYLAGNAMNAIFVLISMLLFPKYNAYLYLVVSNMLINFIPIVKSDGYYAFVSLFNRYTKEKSKKATFLEDTVRGLIMFLLLSALSYIT